MVWAEDVMAGIRRMGSAVIMGNAVGGDGSIAEVSFLGWQHVPGCMQQNERCVHGVVAMAAYVGPDLQGEEMEKMRTEKNEVKKMNDVMTTKEVLVMGASAMTIGKKTMATGMHMVAMELVAVVQLLVADGSVPGGESTKIVPTVGVIMNGELDGVCEWEMYKKSFELAQNMTAVAAAVVAMSVGSVVADLAVLVAWPMWSDHIDRADDSTDDADGAAEDAVVTVEMTAMLTTTEAAVVAEDAEESAVETTTAAAAAEKATAAAMKQQ